MAVDSRLLSAGMGRRAPWAPRIGTYPLPAPSSQSLLDQLVTPPLGQQPAPFQPAPQQPAAEPAPAPVVMGQQPINDLAVYGAEGLGGSPDASFGMGEPSPNQSLSGVVDAGMSLLGLAVGGPMAMMAAPAIMGTLAQHGATQPTMSLTSAIAQIMGYPTIGQMVQDRLDPLPTVNNPALTNTAISTPPMNAGMIGSSAGPDIGPTPGFGGGFDAFGQPSLDPGLPTGLTENETAAMAAQMGRGGMTAGTLDDVGQFGAPRGAMSLADAIGAGLVDPGSDFAASWGQYANDYPGGGEIPGVFGGFVGSVPGDYRGGFGYHGLNDPDGPGPGGSSTGTGAQSAEGADAFGGWMTGGYSGDGPANQPMGPVHAREGVLNAAAMDYYGDAARMAVAAINARAVPKSKLAQLVGKP